MILALIIIVSLAFLAVLIKVMLAAQSQQREQLIEHDDSLPPLTETASANLTRLNDEFQQESMTSSKIEEVAVPPSIAPSISPLSSETTKISSMREEPEFTALVAAPVVEVIPVPADKQGAKVASQSDLKVNASAPQNWQDQASALKKAGQLDQALSLCLSALPLMTAFTQATLILREQIRQARKSGNDLESLLTSLYHLSALAGLLHPPNAHNSDEPGLSGLSEHKKQSNQRLRAQYSMFKEFAPDYQQLGYKQLRLLKKTDIDAITLQWGQPKQHAHCFTIYKDIWLSAFAD